MDRSNSYFILSGFISLSLFTVILSFFFLMMFGNPSLKNFALEKDKYISISFNTITTPTKKVIKVSSIKKEEAHVVEVKEVKEIDISDLFSDVWTKDIKIEKKKEVPVNNNHLELIQKKIKKSSKSTTQKLDEATKNDEAVKIDDENKKSSSAKEVNEYLARIQAIVYKYFQPPVNSQGHTVKVIIELSAYGKLVNFRVLTYSKSQLLNKECDQIKVRLLGALFPRNPDGVSSQTIVNITSDK